MNGHFLTVAVEGENVQVVKASYCSCLLSETFCRLSAADHFSICFVIIGTDNFDSYLLTNSFILSQIDSAPTSNT